MGEPWLWHTFLWTGSHYKTCWKFLLRTELYIHRPYRGGLPRWLIAKEFTCTGDTEDAGSTPGLGRFPEVGNGNPLQYSFLEDSMDREAWRATVHGVAKSKMWLSVQRAVVGGLMISHSFILLWITGKPASATVQVPRTQFRTPLPEWKRGLQSSRLPDTPWSAWLYLFSFSWGNYKIVSVPRL